jgi:hypothetical protein
VAEDDVDALDGLRRDRADAEYGDFAQQRFDADHLEAGGRRSPSGSSTPQPASSPGRGAPERRSADHRQTTNRPHPGGIQRHPTSLPDAENRL